MPEYTAPRIETLLRDLPRREFRARLKRDLEGMAAMTTTVETTSAARQTATAGLRIKNAQAAIEFYKRAFGARELMRFEAGGSVAHAELEIGNSVFYVGEAAPEWGYPGPDALGGSPVRMHLNVDDVDGFVDHAVAEGARLITAPSNQFYGDRTGHVEDPFGYTWAISTRVEEMSLEEMHRRMAAEMGQQAARTAASFIPAGFHTVTPYVVVHDAPGLIGFVQKAFGAEELRRGSGSGGGIHAEVRVGDSMLMIGGAPSGEQRPTAFHVYVPDTDAVFRHAIDAGGTSMGEPTDQPYGERSAGVKDPYGNVWYIATAKGPRYMPEGMQTVNVYLHPRRAEPVLTFLTRGFGATDIQKFASPDGVIQHASARIGDTVIEMGEANGPYQPMPTRFYMYVEHVEPAYRRALQAGASSISEPADQAYGDRVAAVADAFGNQWFIATQIRETR